MFGVSQGSILGFLADLADLRKTVPNTSLPLTWMILPHPLSKHPMPCLNDLKTIFWKVMLTNFICWLVKTRANINVVGYKTEKSNAEKLLGVKFDKELTFDDHISNMVEKYLLWPQLHHKWELQRDAQSRTLFHLTVKLLPSSLDVP